MTYADGGFVCCGVAVGFIAWRFVNNLPREEYVLKNISPTITLTVGGVLSKYLDTSNTNAAPSYFYGLVIGIVVYNLYGLIWPRLEKNDPSTVTKDIDALKADVAALKAASATSSNTIGKTPA